MLVNLIHECKTRYLSLCVKLTFIHGLVRESRFPSMPQCKTGDMALISAGRVKPQEQQSLIQNEMILLLCVMKLFIRDAAGSELEL